VKAQDHPEYAQEQKHLKDTLAALEGRIKEIGRSNPIGGDEHATQALFKHYGAEYKRLYLARPSPYFGRIDFVPDDADETETYYIGKHGFSHNSQQIVDWEAPIAALFYEGGPGEISYHCPDGKVKGLMLLKRNLGIESGELISIADDFDLREEPGVRRSIVVDPDEYLRQVLAGKHDSQLREIVATIQAQQYQLIRANPDQVLVIQGSAGSGKTSIALHRMAFLLYSSKEKGIQAQNCIIFGPNRLFLNYVSQVLPDLGVEGITQKTLVDWACEHMGLRGVEFTDIVLDAILSPRATREEKIVHYRRSRLKSSHRMGELLERYVERRRRQTTFPEEGLSYTAIGPLQITVHLTNTQIGEAHNSFINLPLSKHRERFLETLRRTAGGQYDAAIKDKTKELAEPGRRFLAQATRLREEAEEMDKLADSIRQTDDINLQQNMTAESLERGATGLRDSAAYYQQHGERIVAYADSQREKVEEEKTWQKALNELGERITVDIDRCWPALDTIMDYHSLLTDKSLLNKIGHDLFKPDEIDQLYESERPKKNIIDLSDLPGLHFLHTIANGVAIPPYDHVILDEAQDVSPLQLETIRRFSRNGSLTVLGDLAQSIYAHRGIATWDEVKNAFPDFKYSYNEVKKSYRCTYEIMRFANIVLRSIAQKGRAVTLAEPFERHGEKPGIHQVTETELPAKIAKLAQQLNREYRNIAIITKTTDYCSKLAVLLRQAKLDQFAVATSVDFEYKGGIVVLPVHLAKGMEFEAALVVGTDDRTYTATEFDGRLLYVALTRALHVLHILWIGNVTMHLAPIVTSPTAQRTAQPTEKRRR